MRHRLAAGDRVRPTRGRRWRDRHPDDHRPTRRSTQLVFGPATAGKGLGGHPLYRYSGDTKPGDVNGQGIGGVWSAAGPDGQPVT
jgi:hypothetical protein